METLKNKTLFITGSSRGIGRAIALRAAADGANIAIAAKTDKPHSKLPGTVHSVADEVKRVGGRALPLKVDVRDETQIAAAVENTVAQFGGIDILINNASAISLTDTSNTSMKRFDLMMDVNVRGTFACSQACVPQLKQAENPHILNLSPPLVMQPKWFKDHLAYTLSKYGMSMCVLGMAEELKAHGIAVNALWPRTVIDTAALRMLGGVVKPEHCRSPQIVADAAHAILLRDSQTCTGNFFIDDEVLASLGVSDFEAYARVPASALYLDLFIE